LLNASVGFQRVIGRLRRPLILESDPALLLQTRSVAAARQVRSSISAVATAARQHTVSHPASPTLATPRYRARSRSLGYAARRERVGLLTRLGPDRVVGLAVAGIVLGASVISVSAGTPGSNGPVGGTTGDGDGPRIAVGGGAGLERNDDPIDEYDVYSDVATVTTGDRVLGIDLREPDFVDTTGAGVTTTVGSLVGITGPFLEDGTLLKPIAVDTTVEDGSDLLRTYKVKAGDTLTGIASKFDVSMMTLWWANDLDSKDELHQGQVLTIPPISGLVLTVTANDTLDTIAAKYKVDKDRILKTNDLTDPNLVVGQVLVVPGAKGKPIPTPKPVKRAAISKPRSSGGGSSRPPTKYTGGRFSWPVSGGGNYISQYYHYGHYAIDIAADYGSRVRAAGGGTVIWAGWKSNGGGYQVWIAHGSGLYSTYNHMSAVTVGRGQHVGRGQQVGRVGQSGNASGPHLHFEVWRGPVWDGGTRVNPLAYL
jgi:murein DD-endopeptidase MepM/ murein hydrolase activator NlpD